MEYAMCSLITGKRNFNSLFGVTNHELAHTWFQFLLASNESKHPWMDEGFTVYISNKAGNEILGRNRTETLFCIIFMDSDFYVTTKSWHAYQKIHPDDFSPGGPERHKLKNVTLIKLLKLHVIRFQHKKKHPIKITHPPAPGPPGCEDRVQGAG